MNRLLGKFVALTEVTRAGMALGAVAEVWLIALLTRADPRYSYLPVYDMPLPTALLCTAATALGLFAFGAALNDFLDSRHDRAFSPYRPIPAGDLTSAQVLVIVVGSLLTAFAAALPLGEWALVLCLLSAAGIVLFNVAGKYLPAVGVVLLGLVHAGHMLIPNAQMTFTLPIWLAMTHAMAIAAISYSLEDKRPRIDRRMMVGVFAGWIFWSAALLFAGVTQAGSAGYWPGEPWKVLLPPVIAVVAFILVAKLKIARAKSPKSAADKLIRYGSLWQAVYAMSWLIGCNLVTGAWATGALALIGFTLSIFAREVATLFGKPVGWRG
ncbi:MAG: hypothetical protein EXS00_03040 [Phycisphaerales bacterium]|nr:hypothetical protein [Phycisphaerales bacterium]